MVSPPILVTAIVAAAAGGSRQHTIFEFFELFEIIVDKASIAHYINMPLVVRVAG